MSTNYINIKEVLLQKENLPLLDVRTVAEFEQAHVPGALSFPIFSNEERFVIAFVGGKFRMKQWGRVKIKLALQQKRISTYCVKIGLKEIDEAVYHATLQKLAKKKLASLKGEKNIFITLTKLRNYLLQKGYESPLVMNVVNELTQKNK